jgi:hypothetical protein
MVRVLGVFPIPGARRGSVDALRDGAWPGIVEQVGLEAMEGVDVLLYPIGRRGTMRDLDKVPGHDPGMGVILRLIQCTQERTDHFPRTIAPW